MAQEFADLYRDYGDGLEVLEASARIACRLSAHDAAAIQMM